MQRAVTVSVVVLVCLAVLLEAKGSPRQNGRQKGKDGRRGETTALPVDCGPWTDGQCVVRNNATCGKGTMLKTRTGENCPEKERSSKCEIPCPGGAAKGAGGRKGNKNKKTSCKYDKGQWSECDTTTNTRTRTDTLKTPRRNSAPSTDCPPTKVQTRKCPAGRKGRRGSGGQ